MNEFVVIEDQVYAVDTLKQIEEVEELLANIGQRSARVLVGEPEDCAFNGMVVFASEKN